MLICDADDVGAEGENETSADHPLSSLSSLSTHSTSSPLLLSISLLFAFLFILVWQRNEDLNVVEREETGQAVQHALIPVLIDLIGQGDDVALVEAQLSLVFWLEVV